MKNSALVEQSPARRSTRSLLPVQTASQPEIAHRLRAIEEAAVVQSIGGTPLVRLRTLERHLGLPASIELHLKTEWVNPGGSIKDRTALSIVRAAVASNDLKPAQRLIDATSGNTGIAYAMLGAALGIPVTLVVPDSASLERKTTLAAYGAEVVFSDPYEGSDG
ncbi:MAG: pyridoxal-phosphate dependent enzyme, partial [Chloroflexia bacterium]|nr:pyridoxal-phosphate dependent enzyme [Chloroflexia bacterium]